MSIRRFAELVCGRIEFTRRLPSTSGSGLIRVSTRVGGLKYLFKTASHWDEELLSMAKLLVAPNEHVWDVGANVGLFSMAAAFHAGEGGSILSIEADIDAIALLHSTASNHWANHARISVLPVAISDDNGVVVFAIAQRARAANAIHGYGSSQMGGVSSVRAVPCMTLDRLLAFYPAPDVLKIDVEGAETLVLRGAREVLHQYRPKIYCEVNCNTAPVVCAWLKELGYAVWDGGGFVHGTRDPVSHATTNLVAIHSGEDKNRPS